MGGKDVVFILQLEVEVMKGDGRLPSPTLVSTNQGPGFMVGWSTADPG